MLAPSANPSGVACAVDLHVAGRAVRALGTVHCTESAAAGTSLRFRLDPDEARDVRLGDPVRLDWTPREEEEASGTLKLWCGAITILERGGQTVVEVEAMDPLAFTSNERAFRSWNGRQPLLHLVDQVLRVQPGALPELPAAAQSPAVELDWLLQADETGAEFLRRIAAIHGRVLFWSRAAWSLSQVDVAGNGPTIRLEPGGRLFGVARRVAPDHAIDGISWIEAGTRRARRRKLDGRRLRGGPGALPQGRWGGALPGAPARLDVPAGAEGPGERVTVWSSDGRVSPGATIETANGTPMRVECVEHRFDRGVSYLNTARGVVPERWGRSCWLAPRGTIGSLQAEVTHNDDPNRLGRIRVRLSDDPERRPTPWIPCAHVAAASAVGLHWPHEVGSLVLVSAPLESPESLVVNGGVRGDRQTADAAWNSSRNGVKAIVTKEKFGIVFDEERGELRLVVGDTTLVLSNSGVSLKGNEIRLHADGRVEIEGGNHVSVDATRIDLGR